MDDEQAPTRRPEEPAGGPGQPPERRDEEEAPPSGEVRIAAVEAAVAAGLAPSTGRHEAVPPAPPPPTIELPDWTDPPTGQVPRVLLGEGEGVDDPVLRGPTWREDAADWENEVDLSFLGEQEPDEVESVIAGRDEVPTEVVPNPFEFTELDTVTAPAESDPDDAWAPLFVEGEEGGEEGGLATRRRRAARRHKAHRARRPRPAPEAVPGRVPPARPPAQRHRSTAVATATGLVIGVLALLCLLAGSVTSLVLVAIVVVLAAGEAFGALRRGGYKPAVLVGLLAVPLLVVAAYLHGPPGIVLIGVIAFVCTALWFLAQHIDTELVGDLGATLLVTTWIGGCAAFAGLLLAPASFPHRHGVVFLGAAIVTTVAHDIASYAVGSRFGRHLVVPSVSPNKSLEGLAGGTVAALLVGSLVAGNISPLTPTHGLVLGVLVAVFAPLGDLVESLVKRSLGIKDMSHLLPAHGGVLDRVDALLFVLPATYYLVRALNLG